LFPYFSQTLNLLVAKFTHNLYFVYDKKELYDSVTYK